MSFSTKKVAIIITIIILITSSIGCQRSMTDRNAQYDEEELANKEVVIVRVWTDNAHEKELRLEQIEKFNNTTGKEKGIKIKYTVYGAEYQEVIKQAASLGTAPELFRPTGSFITEFVEKDYLIPINELPKSDAFTKKYEGELVNNQHIFNGKVYTLPYNLTTFKFIINNDLFEKAGIDQYPKNWQEVRVAAKKITESGNGKEFGWILGLQSNWMISTYIIRVNAGNVGHIGFNYETHEFDYSAFYPAIEAIEGMISDGSVFPGYESLDADMVRAHFAEGRIGMIPGASYDTAVYYNQFPAKFNWSVISVPVFSGNRSNYSEFVEATSLLGVGAAARDKPKETLEVLKFFYSDENAAQMYEQALYIPFRQEAIKLAKTEPVQKGFSDFANIPSSLLILPTPEDRINIKGAPYRVTIGEIFKGSLKNIESSKVLEDLDRRYNEAFHQLEDDIIMQYRKNEIDIN